MGLFVVGVIGFIVCGIILLIKAIRKKPKKAAGILTGAFFVVALATMIWAMNTPAAETVKADYYKIMAGEMNGQIVDLVGDIEDIKRDGELYFVTIRASDGVYEAVALEDTGGKFPNVGDKRVKMYIVPDYTDDGQLVITIIGFRQ